MNEAKRLKSLEDENARLEKLLAESHLDIAALNAPKGHPAVKKMVRPAVKREAVAHLQTQHGFSQRAPSGQGPVS